MARPVVFVSSTVHDLGDMRSAIKYWLEGWGYEVRLSEYADFPDVLDKNSYEACLDAVRSADYCIVLIGNRAGGAWDADDHTSISRREYQVAYEVAQTGGMKVLVFVRDAVWTVFLDRRGAANALHSSPIIQERDASYVFPFIEEARRADEMRAAAEGVGERPVNNWVYQFKAFEDVVTAIRTQFRLDRPVRQAAIEANLLWELQENLCQLADKEDGPVRFHHRHWPAARLLRDLDVSDCDPSSTHAFDSASDLKEIAFYAAIAPGRSLLVKALNDAIGSGVFLKHNPRTGASKVGAVQEYLLHLRHHISYWTLESTRQDLVSFAGAHGAPTSGAVPQHELMMVLCAFEVHWRIAEMTIGLALYPRTQDEAFLRPIHRTGRSPLIGMRKHVRDARLTHEDLEVFLGELETSGDWQAAPDQSSE